MKREITFKEAYKFPLELFHGLVFTSDHDKAFDFANRFHCANPLQLTTESKEKIIAVINGDDRKLNIKLELSYSPEDGWIYAVHEGIKKQFILIRGWGMLTGIGGLNLDDETASKLQDEFANHIVNVLTLACSDNTQPPSQQTP